MNDYKRETSGINIAKEYHCCVQRLLKTMPVMHEESTSCHLLPSCICTDHCVSFYLEFVSHFVYCPESQEPQSAANAQIGFMTVILNFYE